MKNPWMYNIIYLVSFEKHLKWLIQCKDSLCAVEHMKSIVQFQNTLYLRYDLQ